MRYMSDEGRFRLSNLHHTRVSENKFDRPTYTVHGNYRSLDARCQWHGQERTRRGRTGTCVGAKQRRWLAGRLRGCAAATTQLRGRWMAQIRLAPVYTVTRLCLLSICRRRVVIVGEFTGAATSYHHHRRCCCCCCFINCLHTCSAMQWSWPSLTLASVLKTKLFEFPIRIERC